MQIEMNQIWDNYNKYLKNQEYFWIIMIYVIYLMKQMKMVVVILNKMN